METIVPVIPSNLTAGDKTASRKYCSFVSLSNIIF
jgi:hypothetical protein